MKIEIELSDDDVAFLSKWASVSRTLNSARVGLDRLLDFVDDSTTSADRVNICLEELEQLEPWLNRLHQTVRNEIWKQQMAAEAAKGERR